MSKAGKVGILGVLLVCLGLTSLNAQVKSVVARKIEDLEGGIGGKYAVIVGIDDYSGVGMDSLSFAASDAKELYRLLTDPEYGAFARENVKLMTPDAEDPNDLPARENILARVATWLGQAKEGDTILFYFSGHGMEEGGRSYLVAANTKMSLLADTAVGSQRVLELMASSKASKRILILDSCYSGAKGGDRMGVGMEEVLSASEGWVKIASCRRDEQSYERKDVPYSAFTYAVLQGLRGGADDNRDGFVTCAELNLFAWTEVCRWAADNNVKQTPTYSAEISGEIVLSLAGGGVSGALPAEVGGAVLSSAVVAVRALAPGTVKVNSNVEGAKVLLDGAQVGIVASGSCEVTVPRGSLAQQHVVRVEEGGYNPWESDPFICPSEAGVQMRATLKKLEAILVVTSDPPRATVKVDGVEWGETPLIRTLSSDTPTPKEHSITLELPGYETWVSSHFSVKLGERLAIDRKLSRFISPPPELSSKGKIAFTHEDGYIYVMNADGTDQTNLAPNTARGVDPTWSPDGSKIAFASQRDGNFEIYAMNSDGTNQTNLTNNKARDSDPSWSPDGKKIAFTSERDGEMDIYVMNPDGSNQTRLTNEPKVDQDPCWSPDGSKIAFWSDREHLPKIFVMNADGTGQKRVDDSDYWEYVPSWSPDGSKMTFTSSSHVAGLGADVYVMNSDGTNIVNLTEDPADDTYARWSPDGEWITFCSDRDGNYDIYVMRAAGGTPIRLTRDLGFDHLPSWSPLPERFTGPSAAVPANNKIAFVSSRDGNSEIYVMNADSTNQTRLTNNRAWDGGPAWSPDGTRIAFTSGREGEYNDDVYVMNWDGTNLTRLTDNPKHDSSPTWSPDGKKIAFVSYRDGNDEIYVMNSDGSNQIRLTNDEADDNQPSWSPDGRRIVFIHDRYERSDLYLMNSDGTNRTRLTNNRAGDWSPSWSPDGSKIAFSSHRDGNRDIYVIGSDGTNLTRLTSAPEIDDSTSWSPDGSKIAFTSNRDGNDEVYVMNSDGTNQTRITYNEAGDAGPSWSPF